MDSRRPLCPCVALILLILGERPTCLLRMVVRGTGRRLTNHNWRGLVFECRGYVPGLTARRDRSSRQGILDGLAIERGELKLNIVRIAEGQNIQAEILAQILDATVCDTPRAEQPLCRVKLITATDGKA